MGVLLFLAFVFTALAQPHLPDQMASHWNSRSEVNGYLPKAIASFLTPAVSTLVAFMFILIPRVDPLSKNIGKFRKYYDGLVLFLVAFLLYIHALTMAWNFGMTFDMTRMLAPAFGMLMYYTGIVLENSEQNWFVGLRTPWTLSSKKVWEKTHERVGLLFRFVGILALLGVVFPQQALFLMVVPVLVALLYSIYFSYAEFNRGKHK